MNCSRVPAGCAGILTVWVPVASSSTEKLNAGMTNAREQDWVLLVTRFRVRSWLAGAFSSRGLYPLLVTLRLICPPPTGIATAVACPFAAGFRLVLTLGSRVVSAEAVAWLLEVMLCASRVNRNWGTHQVQAGIEGEDRQQQQDHCHDLHEVFLGQRAQLGRQVCQREEHRAGAQDESEHDDRARQRIGCADRQRHHRLRYSAGDENGQQAHEERREKRSLLFGFTPDEPCDETGRFEAEKAEDRMHVQHAQRISDHEDRDRHLQDAAHHGREREHRAQPAQQEAQQGIGNQLCQQEHQQRARHLDMFALGLGIPVPPSVAFFDRRLLDIFLDLVGKRAGDQPALHSHAA